jgi:hypothetical protein
MSVSSPYAIFRAVDLGWPLPLSLTSSPLPPRAERQPRPPSATRPHSHGQRAVPRGVARRALSGSETHSLVAVKPKSPRFQPQASLVQGNLFPSPEASP